MSVEIKFSFPDAGAAARFLARVNGAAEAQPEKPAPAPKAEAKAPTATPAPTPAPTAAPSPAPTFAYPTLQKAVFALAAKDKAAVLELAKSFGVATFKDLPAEKWEEAHAAVVAKTEALAVA